VVKRVVCAVALLALWLSVSRAQGDAPQIIVGLNPGQTIDKVIRGTGTHPIRQIPGEPIFLLRVDSGPAIAALQKLLHVSGVDFAEFNRSLRLESGGDLATTSDARLGQSMVALLDQSMAALLDTETTTKFYGTDVLKAYVDQPALQIIGAPATRNISTGARTTIAYIDTGVDPDHPVLQPWLDPGIDLIGNGSISELDGMSDDMTQWVRGNTPSLIDKRLSFLLKQSMAALLDDGSGQTTPAGFPSAFGHGTLVAGVLHAVAPMARIVPIRAFDGYGNTTIFKLAEGIYRAADLNVDVLNMSFSTSEDSTAIEQAVIYAQGRGVALVSSVGNESTDAGGLYPASCPLVNSVAATDFDDHLAFFSNYGSVVTISAPGSYVISTAPGGRYAMAWGTSFSAPIVSGSIALVAALKPRWVGSRTGGAVRTTAVPIDAINPGYAGELGTGRVYLPNVFSAIFGTGSVDDSQ